MAESTAQWAAPGPSAPPTRPQQLGAGGPYGAPLGLPPGSQPGFQGGVQAGVQPGVHPGVQAGPPSTGPVKSVAAKPGRRTGTRPIPLRPLSVIEVVDAGVGALRSIPRRVHLLAAAITVGLCLTGFGLLYLVQHIVDVKVSQGSYSSTDFFGDVTVYEGVASPTTNFGRFVLDVLFAVVFSGLAANIAAGLYATSVQRYVDGQPADLAAAQAGYRGRRGKLAWLTLIAALPRLALLGLTVLITLVSAGNPDGDYGPGLAWLLILGIPTCWLFTAQFAVASPVLVLERTPAGKALSRSIKLAAGGRWRTVWTRFFTLLMAASPFLLLLVYVFFIRVEEDASGPIFGSFSVLQLALTALVVVASVPVRATAATMLYVDRRFRREGLDVRIAWARVAKETL